MTLQTRKRPISATGFTLIELLIAISIVGILAGVGVPSLLDQLTQSRRADGMIELSRVLKHQERYFLNNMTYVTDLSSLGFTLEDSAVISAEGHYRITATTCEDTVIARCVLLQASPVDSRKDDGALTLTSRGEKDWKGNEAGDTGWPE